MYGTNVLSKFNPDTKLVLYPLQDKLTSGDKSLDLSAFKLSRLFFSLLSSGSSSCWRSYRAQLRLSILKEDAWEILRTHAKWDAPSPDETIDLTGGEQVPGVGHEELLGEDARPRLGPRQSPSHKKTKSETTPSTGGSNSSNLFVEHMSTEFRLKREAAESAYAVDKVKDRTLMRLEEMKFLATGTKDLSKDDAYWINHKKQTIKDKYKLICD
ncbi:hypothetical protein Tco_0989801 [Tanacetum coccineum]|uniref:No apical meristem-associated C-terminal domain-containing protein n=1 Tax=Tanacetum coccineum TaxID=301880 RepID=A0ABQ5EW88_9ASTR